MEIALPCGYSVAVNLLPVVRCVAFITILLAGLSLSQTRTERKTVEESKVDVPSFAIEVKLSSEANKRLRNLKETVKVIAYFDGDPLPGQGRYNPPMRDVYLGMAEQLVDKNNIARFEHVRVARVDWNRLADKNYFVTINTVSARKVDRNNLLDCIDPISQKIEDFRGKTVEVSCWLIGEARAPSR